MKSASYLKTGLTILSVLLLAACGSSGGGSDSVRGTGATNVPSRTPSTNNTNSTTTNNTPNPNNASSNNGSINPSNNAINNSNSGNQTAHSSTTNTNLNEVIKQTFATDSGGKVQTVKGDYSNYNTTLLSIDATGKGTVSTNVNKALPAEFESIVINDTRVLLLSKVEDRMKTNVALQALDGKDFRSLDGKNAVGIPQGAKGGWVGSIGQFGTMAPGSGWSDMRFGVYVDEKNVSHLFVHGKPANLSSTATGVVAYTGSAVIGKDGNYRPLPNSVSGVVDWNNKVVNLNITDGSNQIKVGGNIKGNTFEGLNDGVQTRGAFYGSSELGGMFNATSGQYNGYNGVFGATKGRVVSP